MKKKQYAFIFLATLFLFAGCGKNEGADIVDDKDVMTEGSEFDTRTTSLPRFNGKLIYHNYSDYGARDSRIWLYDFRTNQLTCLSNSWNIIDPMNAHFSPDGRKIVFMGIDPIRDKWSIYLYDFSVGGHPTNISYGSYWRDEDPKFSPDGRKITFKRNLTAAVMDLHTRAVKILSGQEYSMPYFNSAGNKIVCSKGAGRNSSLCVIDVNTRVIREIYNAYDLQDYYPINADATSFYYTRGYSTSQRYDQIYRGYWDGRPSVRLPFNRVDGDYSDAYPINSEWVVLSSTRPGAVGRYDLYVANVRTGAIYSLSRYNNNINTSLSELGACTYIY